MSRNRRSITLIPFNIGEDRFYEVVKAINVTSYKIGDKLTESDLKRINGIDFTIVKQKGG